MELDAHRAANLANWNERVAGHMAPDGYGVDGFVADPDRITGVVRFDAAVLGDVADLTLLHPQCHIGTDTLSWAKLGAQVTGFDFSATAISAARDLASRLGLEANFVECELYSAPAHIEGPFDIVYTGVGAINWLPDIAEWGRIMAGFVRPGGRFYIREGHPMMSTLDDERDDRELVVAYRYFDTGEPEGWVSDESYLGSATLENTQTYEWPHPISDVVNSLIDAGLVIERLDEHQHLDWRFFHFVEETDEGFVLPEALRDRVPLQYSILATKPT